MESKQTFTVTDYLEHWCGSIRGLDELRIVSANAGLKLISLYECSYAQCHEINCIKLHPAVFTVTTDVFWALSDIIKLIQSNYQANCIYNKLYHKYYAFLKAKYGVTNAVLLELENIKM